jgi:hypothetical protein
MKSEQNLRRIKYRICGDRRGVMREISSGAERKIGRFVGNRV